MAFRSVRDLDVKGRRVFLRADLNVPLKEGRITDAKTLTGLLWLQNHLRGDWPLSWQRMD